MSDLDVEQLEHEAFLAEVHDAGQVLTAKRAFGEVMPSLASRLFDPEAQQAAREFLASPLLQEATRAFNERWAGHETGDAA